MTSQRMVEDFARWMWLRDTDRSADPIGTYERSARQVGRVPDNYLNEAAVFLAGPLGQQLQHREQPQHQGHWCVECQDEIDHG